TVASEVDTDTVGRPDTSRIWSSATSAAGSAPTTSAGYVPGRPSIATRTLVAPRITWLFVRTSPVVVRIIPVPEALPCEKPLPGTPVPITVVMSTTAGSTLAATDRR